MRPPVLLHGFTGSSASWGDAIVDGLASAGLPPVLLDTPGHGRHAGETDPERFTRSAAHAAVQAALAGEPAPLVGYSMGARLALDFAVAHPQSVSRLVLESGSPGLATEEERAARRAADEALAGRIASHGVERFVDDWEALPLFETQRALPPEVRARVRAVRLRNDAASLGAALRGLGTGALPSHWGALRSLRAPTLLVAGSLDAKFASLAERMAASMPHARAVVVPGAGHAVHLERPAAWLEAVVDFLVGGG